MATYIPLRLFFGIGLTISLWYFASLFIKDKKNLNISFYCLLIGGGITSLLVAGACLIYKKSSMSDFFYFYQAIEGGATWWFLNVFRNFFYVTETMYHFLFILTLVCILKKFWKLSLLFLFLTLFAHPFTGFQLGLVYIGYFLASILIEKSNRRQYFIFGACAIVIYFSFLYYNLIWLRQFPGHDYVVKQWELYQFILPLRGLFVSYGIWLCFGLYAILRYFKFFLLSSNWRLLLVILAVNPLLVMHHYFSPYIIQPAHFSHGYLFTVLVLFTFFLFEKWKGYTNHLKKLFQRPILICVVMVIIAFDNLCFMYFVYDSGKSRGCTITKEEKETLDFLSVQKKQLTVVTRDSIVGYLIPVFTRHKTVVGHYAVTPDVDTKKILISNLIDKGQLDLFRECVDINAIIVSNNDEALLAKYSFFKKFKKVFCNRKFSIYLIDT
jgi:hypothetical protein